MGELIPDGWPAPIFVYRPFDLVRRGTDTPEKIGWEGRGDLGGKGRETAQGARNGVRRVASGGDQIQNTLARLNIDIGFAIERTRNSRLGDSRPPRKFRKGDALAHRLLTRCICDANLACWSFRRLRRMRTHAERLPSKRLRRRC